MTTKELEMQPGKPGVKQLQEWLTLHGFGLVVDGIQGPATNAAIRSFQASRGIHTEDGAGARTWTELVAPLRRALQPIEPMERNTLGAEALRYGRQHLAEHPVEVGGANAGPWVRLYMNGRQGPLWPWCAGFVMCLLRQACESTGQQMPLPHAYGCDYIAGKAQAAGLFASGKTTRPEPGWLFLVPRGSMPGHWAHIGIVLATDRVETCSTIEGNTNDSGSAEGFEVCARTRTIRNLDFIRI